jgi:uncharacterized repeat protein (TIGR01451 family)
VLNTFGVPLPSFTNIGYVASDPSDFDRSDNLAKVVTTLNPAADLAVTINSAPAGSVGASGTLTYTITVTNNGPDAASGVILTENLPNTVSILSLTQSQGLLPVLAGTQVTESFGNIASKGTATLTIVTQAPPVADSLNDSASVTSSTPDPNLINNAALNTVTVTPISDIQVSLTASSPTVLAGQQIIYTLTATNMGPSVADGVLVTDKLPLAALATFVSATADSGPSPTLANGVVTDNFGTLNPNQSVTITITVLTTVNAPPNVTDTAAATSNATDPVTTNNSASVTTTVVPDADVAITSITANPASLTATHNLTITIGFVNNGPSAATGVSVIDTLPTGFTFVSASTSIGTFKVSGQTVTVNAGTMPVGATGTLTINATTTLLAVGNDTDSASISATLADPNVDNNTMSTPITIVPPIADMSVTSATANPSRVLVGGNATFVVNVMNSGPDPATGAQLTDVVPNGMLILSVLSSAGAVSVSGNTIFAPLGTMAPGATATLTIVAQATSNGVGAASNTATVSANVLDPDTSNNSMSATTTVSVPLADLAIASVTATPSAALLGQNVTFSIAIVNNGPDQSTGGTIIDSLPAGLTLVSATVNNGSVLSQNNAAVATLPTLNSGGTAILTIVAKTTALGSIGNGATISGNQVDPTPGNNSGATAITVSPAADLQVKIVPTPVPGLSGQNLTYTVTVTNAGPSTATNVSLSDTLPSTVNYVSATSSQGSAPTQASGVITALIGTLAPNATATLTIVGLPTGAAVGLVTDTATATSDQANPKPSDASAKSITTISAVANLNIAAIGSSDQVVTGHTLTYTITVTNPVTGPNDATNVLVVDTLPPSVTFGSVTTSAGTASFALGTVTALLGDIPVGQSATIVINVTPKSAITISNVATVEADEPDPAGVSLASVNTTVVTPPGVFSFHQSALTAPETAGTIPITIDRTGGFQGVVTVVLSTVPGGNATPGVDYVPFTQTLVFGQGVISQTVNLRVLPDPNDRVNELVHLQLSAPTNGASLGPVPTAIATIVNTDPNIVGPAVTSLRLIGPATAITSLDFTFNKPLNPLSAINTNNYHIFAPGNVPVPVASAVYDPTTLSVFVTPAVPLKANVSYLAVANGTTPGAISDLAGNPLNSIFNVAPGVNFVSPVARGTKFSYVDGAGAVIGLQIQGGGILDLTDFAQGQAATLQVLNPVPHRTVITGSVRPGGKRTQFFQILGLGKFGAVSANLFVGPFFPRNFPFTSTHSVDAPAVDVLLPKGAAKPSARVGAKAVIKAAKHR